MVRHLSFRVPYMAWIVLAIAVLHALGISWGLPGSDGWDNDGIAPRDFLPGLAETFTSGHYYTYPPVHLALLAILTLPVTIAGYLCAPSHDLASVVREMLKPGYMTTFAYIARFVSLVMSLGIALFAARIAEEVRAEQLGVAPVRRHWLEGDYDDDRVRRVGWCTAAFVGLEATLTYYAHTTNLDVPYLFWGTWGLLFVARAVARNEPHLYRRAFVLAVLAIGTKDQAYALFGLSIPFMFKRAHARDLAKAAAIAVALFLVTDAVIFNPSGFLARVHFLTGPASQDFVEYTRDWSGRFRLLADAARTFDLQVPRLALVLVAIGLARTRRRVGLLPLLVAVSFTLLFNWASLRTNARFLMPQGVMLGIYGGLGAEAVAFHAQRSVRALVLIPAAFALYLCVCVDVNLLADPRYDTEAWLRAHVKPGETIETYGLNVYLPRFPQDRRVIRVGPEPVAKRNPMPGITEVEDAYDHAAQRDAQWIVVSVGWGWRYLIPPKLDLGTGRILAPNQERTASEEASATYFRRLSYSQDAFVFAHGSEYAHPWFPVLDIHGDTGRPIWIYERKPPR